MGAESGDVHSGDFRIVSDPALIDPIGMERLKRALILTDDLPFRADARDTTNNFFLLHTLRN